MSELHLKIRFKEAFFDENGYCDRIGFSIDAGPDKDFVDPDEILYLDGYGSDVAWDGAYGDALEEGASKRDIDFVQGVFEESLLRHTLLMMAIGWMAKDTSEFNPTV